MGFKTKSYVCKKKSRIVHRQENTFASYGLRKREKNNNDLNQRFYFPRTIKRLLIIKAASKRRQAWWLVHPVNQTAHTNSQQFDGYADFARCRRCVHRFHFYLFLNFRRRNQSTAIEWRQPRTNRFSREYSLVSWRSLRYVTWMTGRQNWGHRESDRDWHEKQNWGKSPTASWSQSPLKIHL